MAAVRNISSVLEWKMTSRSRSNAPGTVASEAAAAARRSGSYFTALAVGT